MNPVTAAVPLTSEQTSGTAMGNTNIIAGILCALGVVLAASRHPVLGIPLIGCGVISFKFLDCYTIPAGNVYGGQTQCVSILSKMIGPM